MKMLVFLTQLGLSVAFPLAGFVWLAVWLRERYSLGSWVILAGAGIGVVCAINGLRSTLRVMYQLSREKKAKNEETVNFHDHE